MGPGRVKFEVFPVWTLILKADILFTTPGSRRPISPERKIDPCAKYLGNAQGERQLLIFHRVVIADNGREQGKKNIL
jgi:hypothetical protein